MKVGGVFGLVLLVGNHKVAPGLEAGGNALLEGSGDIPSSPTQRPGRCSRVGNLRWPAPPTHSNRRCARCGQAPPSPTPPGSGLPPPRWLPATDDGNRSIC